MTAKEPTVVLTYHPSALDRMEATESVVFAGLAKSVMANMAWQNSIINADHTHDYFFQSSEHVRCSADGSVDEDRVDNGSLVERAKRNTFLVSKLFDGQAADTLADAVFSPSLSVTSQRGGRARPVSVASPLTPFGSGTKPPLLLHSLSDQSGAGYRAGRRSSTNTPQRSAGVFLFTVTF